MSEKAFRLLLHLYPSRFRQEYWDEALQLFRDRRRDETGMWRSVRLWFDLLADLLISLPREYGRTARVMAGASPKPCLDGTPTFFVFETASPGRRPLLLGGLFSLMALFSLPILMDQATSFRPPSGSNLSPAVAYDKQPERPTSQTEQGISQKARSGNPTLNAASRRRIIANAIAAIKQHHLDAREAQEAASALLDHERQGDDDSATSVTEFSRIATRQMRAATGDKELELLFSMRAIPERRPGEPLTFSAGYQNEMRRINCAFERVEILPHNIGYIKLNAFPDTSACQATAVAAMAKVNGADALIFDLRDNGGGFPSMVSLISAYLFDHPEYLYCPLENTSAESWTHSPIPGNELVNKPVYVLTSHRTISAAEEFAYNLKMLRRATLVGETTAGGGHAANIHGIGDDFYVATVEVRAINPYGKGDWNNTGIEPDVRVRAPDALKAALKLAENKLRVD